MTFKKIYPKGNGSIKWKCQKGHISNYRIGTGTLKNPYKCPVCEGRNSSIRNELEKLNNKYKER